ncbi:MAG TPA: M48 family peptidase, partial [Isosphaeraceae bacterium]|nr:M48 family peptidase [Isosphaeraceae bacterium]
MSYGDSGEERRPILNPRLIMAAIIAVVGVVVYFSRMQVNPVTGKKQAIAMSVDQEKALGLQAAPEMAAKMGGGIDPATSGAARLVVEVGRRLVERSDASKSAYAENFR